MDVAVMKPPFNHTCRGVTPSRGNPQKQVTSNSSSSTSSSALSTSTIWSIIALFKQSREYYSVITSLVHIS